MAGRRILLQRSEIAHANHYHLRGFRCRITVAAVEGGMVKDVFVFRRHPADPYTGEVFDEFEGVASFVDISEYPVSAPDSSAPHPFFRGDTIELDFRSTADVLAAWEIIKNQVEALTASMDRADELQVAESIWLGPTTDSSESVAV